MFGGRVVPHDFAGRTETTTNQNASAYMLVSICLRLLDQHCIINYGNHSR